MRDARDTGVCALISFVVGLWLQRSSVNAEEGRCSKWSAWTFHCRGPPDSRSLSDCWVVDSLLIGPRDPRGRSWCHERHRRLCSRGAGRQLRNLADEMQRPVYFLECQCYDTFKLFSRDREDFDETEIPVRVNRALDKLGRNEVLFSFMEPFGPENFKGLHAAGLTAVPVKAFGGADISRRTTTSTGSAGHRRPAADRRLRCARCQACWLVFWLV